ncbi:leucine-rich repeat-containing protein [Vairimorpha apis BRL 01]|uniref:Leucine-rich repeat-containing protein n=1 Tax=Vairimorpha apis BRL 01 TaxID=1037528 RepID=T0MII7_9MICR|nr:leucine-rich repeat-containing protein [Vairimorpha apis BRL 01]
MDNLMFLRLSSNMIKYVPIEFVNLKNLKYLSLAHNKIKEIPENFNNLTKLKCFNIFDNNLQKVPDAIYKMNFKYLNIGNNNINELKSFQNTYIKELSLNQNMISLFPELNINIKILNLNNNKIAKLPDDLHKYIDLEYLDLSFNEIKYISKSFLNHKYKFKYLNLKGNFIQQKGNSKFLGQDDLRKYFQEIIVLDENVENRNKFFKTNSLINLSEKKDLDEDFSINSEREIKNFQSLELNLNYIDINQNDCLTFNNINNQLEEKPITQNLKENYTNDTLKINDVKKLNFGKNKIDDVELANEIDYSLCIIDKDKILHPNENLKNLNLMNYLTLMKKKIKIREQ